MNHLRFVLKENIRFFYLGCCRGLLLTFNIYSQGKTLILIMVIMTNGLSSSSSSTSIVSAYSSAGSYLSDFPATGELIDAYTDLPTGATQIVIDCLFNSGSGVVFDHDLPFIREQLGSYFDEWDVEIFFNRGASCYESSAIINVVADYLSNYDHRIVFDRDLPSICEQLDSPIHEQLDSSTVMSSDLAQIVIDYLCNNDNPFGREEWNAIGLDPGPVPELPKELIDFWYGLDPIDKTKQVCETHIPPVYRPEKVYKIKTSEELNISLAMFQELGFPFLLGRNRPFFQQLKNNTAGLACWLLLRKGVLEETRSRPVDRQVEVMKALNAKTHANYEELPSIIDLACVIFARYALKIERNLGDTTGEENQITRSRCAEMVKTICSSRLEIMGTVTHFDSDLHSSIGGFGPEGVWVSAEMNEFGLETVGLAALRKFRS